MLNLNAYGKRTHNNLTGQEPQVTSNRTHPRGPQVPPRNGNIPIQLRTNQVHQMTNNTSSVLIFAKPFKNRSEQKIVPGHLLFSFPGRNRMSTVLNLPQMNEALGNGEGAAANCIRQAYRNNAAEYGDRNKYYFFGVMRNEANSSRMQRLLNADVHGRSKVCNVWGRNLRRGDILGMALVKRRRHSKANGSDDTDRGEKYQWVPIVNGMLPKYLVDHPNSRITEIRDSANVQRRLPADFKNAKLSPPMTFNIGMVSHAVSEKPSTKAMCDALEQSDCFTALPQIEILMV